MTRFQRVGKALALLSALVLITGFVIYRAGYHKAFMSSSKSTFMFVGEGTKPPETPKKLTDAAVQHEAATEPNPSR
jgi:hypothetical protein